jgi:putative transposase
VATLCRVLQVSVSGYYDWHQREPSRHEREAGERARQIYRIFHAKRQVSGSPPITALLAAQGIGCSKQRVARLMRAMELVAKGRRNRPVGTVRRHGALGEPCLLNREFTAEQPKATWVSDTTSVWTAEGWLSVAILLDLFSRLVGGWAMGAPTAEERVTLALEMALVRRSPPREMLLHSDQGSPSTSLRDLARVADGGIVVSMSRTGDWDDTAVLERFFSPLKGEWVDRQDFQTRHQARLVIFEYIACGYNRERRHSTLSESLVRSLTNHR